jgi:hypothetical protein
LAPRKLSPSRAEPGWSGRISSHMLFQSFSVPTRRKLPSGPSDVGRSADHFDLAQLGRNSSEERTIFRTSQARTSPNVAVWRNR